MKNVLDPQFPARPARRRSKTSIDRRGRSRSAPIQVTAHAQPAPASRRRVGRGLILWALLALLTGFCPLPVSGDDATQQYFEQLRRRRLFDLAEGYALQRLGRQHLSVTDRTDLVLELSRTLSEHAQFTAEDEQQDLWNRAEEVLADAIRQMPENPRRLVLETQSTLIVAGQADYLRWQTETAPFDDALRERALATLTRAVDKLRSLETTLANAVRDSRPRRDLQPDDLRPHELRALWYNVRYELGASLIDQAILLPTGSADRMAALLDADNWLRRLAHGIQGDELTWNSQLLMATSSRLQGELKRASHMLAAIEDDEPAAPAEIRDRVFAERIRLLMVEEGVAQAAQRLLEYRREHDTMAGELHFLNIQLLLQMSELAVENNETELADKLVQQLPSHLQRAEEQVGGYWSYRCRMLAALADDSSKFGRELALLIRQAQASYSAGRIDEAVATYGEAATLAFHSGQGGVAFDLGYTRASVQLQAQQMEAAAESLSELVSQFPDAVRAPQAHLLYGYCLGRLYDQRRTESRRTAYAAVLEEHREEFVGSPTRAEATWMLARLEEQRLQASVALTYYNEITSDERRGSAAKAGVARCYERIIHRLRELQQPTDEWEARSIENLQAFIREFPSDGRQWDVAQAEIALRLARLHLHQERPDYEAAARLLDQISPGHPAVASGDGSQSNAWDSIETVALQLRIVALAGQHRIEEASALVTALDAVDPAAILRILDGLTRLAADTDAATKRDLGELQLRTAESLSARSEPLSDEAQTRLKYCLAEAYVATRQPQKAIEQYQQLLEQFPGDLQLIETTATLLTECGTDKCLATAGPYWRKLESAHTPGSVAWLNARYQVAWCKFAQKRYAECKKLLGVTRLLYPELGGDITKAKFLNLEKLVRSK